MDVIELRYEALRLYRLAQNEPDCGEKQRLTHAAEAAAAQADTLIEE
jgi:hypothetical protein